MNEPNADPDSAWSCFVAGHKEGDVVSGTTTRLQAGRDRFDAVALVDLGGVEGSIHSREVPWSSFPWLPRPGEKVYCPILRIDAETKVVVLGGPLWNWEQWQGVEQRFPVGTRHTAQVTCLTNSGAWVRLEPGVEVLIVLSELQRNQTVERPCDLLSEGQEVEVVVLSVPRHPQQLLLALGLAGRTPRNT
jgi:small subunit ribosomal protein S1